MTKVISFAKEQGCYKIILDCQDKLLDFYKKFGFNQDELHMRLNL